MVSAKQIEIKPISRQDANYIITKLHYSHTYVRNSQIHFGIFLNNTCGGAIQLGPSMDKRKLIGLVKDTPWNGFIELNRMALADWLPRNSESRALSVVLRLLKKGFPFLRWVISFADATQCGDGAIYRAAGFVLTGVKKNNQIWVAPKGKARESRLSLTDQSSVLQKRVARMTVTKGKHIQETGGASMEAYKQAGFKPLTGFQLRYIYFLWPDIQSHLTVPEIPFSKIEEMGARMYRGQRPASIDSDASGIQPGEGGATPTVGL